jgi:hypothetical protein
MVSSAELDRLQRLNFVLQTLQERVTPDAIARELGRDDPQDAALVSQRLRTTADRDAALASMIALYKDVIEAHRQDGAYDPRLDLQAGRCPLFSRHLPPLDPRRCALCVSLVPCYDGSIAPVAGSPVSGD